MAAAAVMVAGQAAENKKPTRQRSLGDGKAERDRQLLAVLRRRRKLALLPSAHHEDIARVRAFTAIAEELQQIVELPMNISTDGHWALHWLHRALLEHQLLHILTQVLQVVLWQQLAIAHFSDPFIQVSSHGDGGRVLDPVGGAEKLRQEVLARAPARVSPLGHTPSRAPLHEVVRPFGQTAAARTRAPAPLARRSL